MCWPIVRLRQLQRRVQITCIFPCTWLVYVLKCCAKHICNRVDHPATPLQISMKRVMSLYTRYLHKLMTSSVRFHCQVMLIFSFQLNINGKLKYKPYLPEKQATSSYFWVCNVVLCECICNIYTGLVSCGLSM